MGIFILIIVGVLLFGIPYYLYPYFHKKQNSTPQTQIKIKENLRVVPEIIEPKKESIKVRKAESKTSYNKIWKAEVIDALNGQQSLADLLIVKEIPKIYYGDLLQCFEWKHKRLMILLRDNFECNNCKKRSIYNHVHHTYYLQDNLPWDIPDEALETLCYQCHKEVHLLSTITVYKELHGHLIESSHEDLNCPRCAGTGYLPHYSHVQNGICFLCHGNLLRQTIFSKVLNKTYENLNDYDEGFLREKYRRDIENLTEDEFFEKIPNYVSYIQTYQSRFNSYIDEEDDLPF